MCVGTAGSSFKIISTNQHVNVRNQSYENMKTMVNVAIHLHYNRSHFWGGKGAVLSVSVLRDHIHAIYLSQSKLILLDEV